MKRLVFIGLLGVLAAAGCGQKTTLPPPLEAPAHQLPTHAQAKLRAIRLWLGPAEVSAEMALTPIEEETGMMFRTNLDENSGMIFVLPYEQRASFWMTNCPLPLSAAYINSQGEIREVHELRANDANAVLAESADILYVLEMGRGWFARHHIEPGTTVLTEMGTLRETFER